MDLDQPGWVACKLIDAHGAVHIFHEKVPVATSLLLDATSTYPQQGSIACTIISHFADVAGHKVITVNTLQPFGVESTGGLSRFEVFENQITDN